MKVFFRDLSEAEIEDRLHPEPGKVSSLALEEVKLLEDEIQTFREGLMKSNRVLPVGARVFRELNVGLVSRFVRWKY